MVGDNIEANVGGGQYAGLTGGFVKSGKHRAATAQSPGEPDAQLASIAGLPSSVPKRLHHAVLTQSTRIIVVIKKSQTED
jgi:ribonucleotide monophosphatase NagD (HAD superfamily)